MYYKGANANKNVLQEQLRNRPIFDYIPKNNATCEYVKVIKEYIEGGGSDRMIAEVQRSRFLMESTEGWSSVYTKDVNTIVCAYPIWRSVDGMYLIFHNKFTWVLTYSQYESELGPGSGGLLSNTGEEPYYNEWTMGCTIKLI